MEQDGGAIQTLKDIIVFEERLASNAAHLQQFRKDILLRWRVMFGLIVSCWLCSRWTRLVLFSVLFYLFLFVFIILVGITLKSGRLFSVETFRQDSRASLLPFNCMFVDDRLMLTSRVPSDMNRLLTFYRTEYLKRRKRDKKSN